MKTISDCIYDLCLGNGNPSGLLLDTGRFPEDWSEKYLEYLTVASREWEKSELVPRRLFAAIHYASFYLHIRYDAYKKFSGSTNAETESILARIRTSSELFLLGHREDHGNPSP